VSSVKHGSIGLCISEDRFEKAEGFEAFCAWGITTSDTGLMKELLTKRKFSEFFSGKISKKISGPEKFRKIFTTSWRVVSD